MLPRPSPPGLPLADPKAKKGGSPAGSWKQPDAVATAQGVAADCRRLQWLLVLKPKGQNRGLCLCPGTQQGLQEICHHLQPRYGRVGSLGTAHCPGLAGFLRGLGLQGRGLLRQKQFSVRGGTFKPLNPGLGGRLEGEAWSTGALWNRKGVLLAGQSLACSALYAPFLQRAARVCKSESFGGRLPRFKSCHLCATLHLSLSLSVPLCLLIGDGGNHTCFTWLL